MVIANPMYDVVFKRLMEDNRIAKFFIGTFLEQDKELNEKNRIIEELMRKIDQK